MSSRRMERVNDLLRAEISELIARELKDPRIQGLISITEVETTPDLRFAKVYVSILGDEAQRRDALKALQHAAGFFRHELGTRLNLRRIPDLDIRLDTSLERGDHIMRLIHQVEQEDAERTKETGEDQGESHQ